MIFSNGTRKLISGSGEHVRIEFPNADVKESFADGCVVYYYAAADTTHTTFPDGLNVYLFSNKQTERHFPDGAKEIMFADGTVKRILANGDSESIFPDGKKIFTKAAPAASAPTGMAAALAPAPAAAAHPAPHYHQQ